MNPGRRQFAAGVLAGFLPIITGRIGPDLTRPLRELFRRKRPGEPLSTDDLVVCEPAPRIVTPDLFFQEHGSELLRLTLQLERTRELICSGFVRKTEIVMLPDQRPVYSTASPLPDIITGSVSPELTVTFLPTGPTTEVQL